MALLRRVPSAAHSGFNSRKNTGLTVLWSVLGLIVSVTGTSAAHALPPLDCVIKPYVTVELGSPVEGVIQEITVERNDLVSRGQVLARLKSDVEKSTVILAKARADLEGAIEARRAALAFGKRKLARTDELYQKKAVSFHIKDEAATDARIAKLKLVEAEENKRIAELELERAQELFNQRIIPSTIDGVVVDRLMAPGEFVDDKPLLKLAQLDPLRVDVILPVTMYGSLHEGMRAVVIPELPESRRYVATVTSVDRVLDGSSGTFGARLVLPNPDHALPGGLRCKLRPLGEGEAPPANAVDTTALPPTPMEEADGETMPATVDTTPPRPAQNTNIAITDEPARETVVSETDEPAPDMAVAETIESVAVAAAVNTAPARADATAVETTKPTQETIVTEPAGSVPVKDPTYSAMLDVPAQPNAQVCGTIGPIFTMGQANKLSKALTGRVTQVNRRVAPPTRVSRYVVVTPRQSSVEQARQLAAELQRKGLKHAFVMTRGNLKGHVSLGLFLNKTNAEKHRAELADRSIESLIEIRYREQRYIWLDFEVPAKELAPVARVVRTAQPGLSLARAVCPPLKTAQK